MGGHTVQSAMSAKPLYVSSPLKQHTPSVFLSFRMKDSCFSMRIEFFSAWHDGKESSQVEAGREGRGGGTFVVAVRRVSRKC